MLGWWRCYSTGTGTWLMGGGKSHFKAISPQSYSCQETHQKQNNNIGIKISNTSNGSHCTGEGSTPLIASGTDKLYCTMG